MGNGNSRGAKKHKRNGRPRGEGASFKGGGRYLGVSR